MIETLWHIRIQRRCEYNGLYALDDWRAYREWLVWPKVWKNKDEAKRFMTNCFTFKNLSGHKLSASVCLCKKQPSPTRGHW